MKLSLEFLYVLTGLVLLCFSFLTLRDTKHIKRYGTALFWFLYSIVFLLGSYMPDLLSGIIVIAMAAIVAFKQLDSGFYGESTHEEKLASSARLGNWLFVPALLIGVITFLVAAFTSLGALMGLGISSIISLIITLIMTKENVVQASQEGRRLIDAIGWAAILSQVLAALGFLFDKAGVGKVVSQIVLGIMPTNSAIAVVFAYCFGMMIFTMVMGNAFAAFAVITSGIGIPLVVQLHGANPAIAGVIAMLAGYCGTLLTPMAANFNIVPAALLEMKQKYGVIKAQLPVAIVLFCFNVLFMYLFAL